MRDIRKPLPNSNYSPNSREASLERRIEEFEKRTYGDGISYGGPSIDEDALAVERKRLYGDKINRYRNNGSAILDEEQVESRERSYTDYEDEQYNVRGDRRGISSSKKAMSSIVDSKNTLIAIASILLIVIFVALETYVFNGANVSIKPLVKKLDGFNFTVPLGAGLDDNSLAYIVATSTVTRSKELPIEGKSKLETRAKGRIIIYNNFDEKPQKLIRNTRFQTSDGYIYRINQSITIPGKKNNVAGSIEVAVEADAVGPLYNKENVDFTIPGLKGSPRYESIFARSKGAIGGGVSGDSFMINSVELNSAVDELLLEMKKDLDGQEANRPPNGYLSFDGLISEDVVSNILLIKSGQSRVYEATMMRTKYFVPNTQVAKVILARLPGVPVLPAHVLSSEGLNIVFDTSVSSTSKVAKVSGVALVEYEIDSPKLQNVLTGKSRADFDVEIKNMDEVGSASVSYSPIWLSGFPDAPSKITIKIENNAK